MDRIDEALSLPTFGAQFRAIKALIKEAWGEDYQQVLDDTRIDAWCRVNRDAISEMIFMSLSEAMNDTIAAQISTPPVTPAGNKRRN